MEAVVQVPLETAEAIAALRLPTKLDQRLQRLMDRNTNGSLTTEEREEFEALVELNEAIALVGAKAIHLLDERLRCCAGAMTEPRRGGT